MCSEMNAQRSQIQSEIEKRFAMRGQSRRARIQVPTTMCCRFAVHDFGERQLFCTRGKIKPLCKEATKTIYMYIVKMISLNYRKEETKTTNID